MGSLWQDVRFGIRMLIRSPVFTGAVVTVLALGMGANTGMFSIIDAALLRPLPFENSDELVSLSAFIPQFNDDVATGAEYYSLADHANSYEAVSAYTYLSRVLTQVDSPKRIVAGMVTASFFPMLGIQPLAGRVFAPAEYRGGSPAPVMVIGYEFWQQHFGGDPSAIGAAVALDGQQLTIIGIMPRTFGFPPEVDVWTPLGLSRAEGADGGPIQLLRIIARLSPNVSLDEARREFGGLLTNLARQSPGQRPAARPLVQRLHERTVRNARPALLALFGAVVLLLLVACANVAGLMLVRATRRKREIAVRAALGASRFRVVRQLLIESITIALIGGMLGLGIAFYGIRLAAALLPQNIARLQPVTLDLSALAYALAAAVLTGLVFGLAPSLSTVSLDLQGALRDVPQTFSPTSATSRMRSLLVATEIALATVLLVAAGLLVKNFLRLVSIDPGYRTENVLTFSTTLNPARYAESANQITYYRSLLDEIVALPGVHSASVTNRLPLSSVPPGRTLFTIEGAPAWRPEEGREHLADIVSVSPDYFSTVGMRLIGGRAFTDRDALDRPRAAIINKTFARRFRSGQDPVGQRLKLGFPEAPLPWRDVVGVVEDVLPIDSDESPDPVIYVPYVQQTGLRTMTFVAKTSGPPEVLIPGIVARAKALDSEQPLYDFVSMDARVAQILGTPRLRAVLVGCFAALGLVLAVVGIYGVVSLSVAQRRLEIGVRMAIGAHPGSILRMMVWQNAVLVAAGIGVGVSGAALLTPHLASLLRGVDPHDGTVFAVVVAVVVAVAMIACYLPARESVRVEPTAALRHG